MQVAVDTPQVGADVRRIVMQINDMNENTCESDLLIGTAGRLYSLRESFIKRASSASRAMMG
jgi:hypothetical protein